MQTFLVIWGNVLFAFKTGYERQSGLSLARSGNLLRVLRDEQKSTLRDLTMLTGVSKEAVEVIWKQAQKRGCAS